ncbi:unnamed protein product [Withania somnifera]
MASHGNDNSGQAQVRRDGQSQEHNFLQETGTQVQKIAQGAADIGKGAAQATVSVARGAALGAANIAQGAADAVKNTVGGGANNNNNDNIATGGIPNYLDEYPKHNPTNTKI